MAEDKETIDQIKREHFIMRGALERIWLMHENAMTNNEPLQERVLWLNVTLAIKKSKPRTTREMGIARVEGMDENRVMFKVGLINTKDKMIKNILEKSGVPDLLTMATNTVAVQMAKYKDELVKGIFHFVTGEELTELNVSRVTIELLGREHEMSSCLTTHQDQYCIDGKPVLIVYPIEIDTKVSSKFTAFFKYKDLVRPVTIAPCNDPIVL